MEKMKNSPAEALKKVEVKAVEMECLDQVFEWLSTGQGNAPSLIA